MGEPYASKLELVSFHTVSKGVYGECGLRGGYFDAMNIHPDAVAGALPLCLSPMCCGFPPPTRSQARAPNI